MLDSIQNRWLRVPLAKPLDFARGNLSLVSKGKSNGFTLVELLAAPAVASSKRRQAQQAFTLVELLVVISIIALLISMLAPALGKAKNAGKVVTCTSNLRELYKAAMAYADENDGEMVMPFTGIVGGPLLGYSRGDSWVSALPEYLGIENPTPDVQNVMHCPVQFPMMDEPFITPTHFTYSENHQITSEAFGISAYNDGSGPNNRTNMVPMSMAILNVSGVVQNNRLPTTAATIPFFLDGWHQNSGFRSWRIRSHAFSYYSNTTQGGSMQALNDAFPHNWKCNAVYLDGHVEMTAWDEGLWDSSIGGPRWRRAQGPGGSSPGSIGINAF